MEAFSPSGTLFLRGVLDKQCLQRLTDGNIADTTKLREW